MNRYIYIEQTNSIILTDYVFWAKNQEKLLAWCIKHNATLQGLSLKFKNHSDVVLFSLEF